MTTHHILAHFQPKTKPALSKAERSNRRTRRPHRPKPIKGYVYEDPYRRLLTAVALQALVDLIWPADNLEPDEALSALRFVTGEREIYLHLGIPVERYNALLEQADA